VTVDNGATLTTDANSGVVDLGTLDLTAGPLVLNTDGTGNATVVNSQVIDFGASSVGGALSATATLGTISQSGGALTVGGNAAFTTSENDQTITLANTSNSFGGTVAFTTNTAGLNNGDVSIAGDALDFAASTIDGNLIASAQTGTISQSGALSVTGTGSFETVANDQAITLSNTSNAIAGAVNFTTATAGGNTGDVVVDNGTTAVNLAASSISGLLEITANTIEVTGAVSANALDFDASGGVGNITDTGAGALNVTSTSQLVAQAGDDIVLDAATNDLVGTVTIYNGALGRDANNVTLVDTNTLALFTTTIGGTLDVTANAIEVTGAVSANTLDFDASGGAGDITDTGAGTLSVTTTSLLVAQDGDDIVLEAANDFGGAVTIDN